LSPRGRGMPAHGLEAVDSVENPDCAVSGFSGALGVRRLVRSGSINGFREGGLPARNPFALRFGRIFEDASAPRGMDPSRGGARFARRCPDRGWEPIAFLPFPRALSIAIPFVQAHASLIRTANPPPSAQAAPGRSKTAFPPEKRKNRGSGNRIGCVSRRRSTAHRSAHPALVEQSVVGQCQRVCCGCGAPADPVGFSTRNYSTRKSRRGSVSPRTFLGRAKKRKKKRKQKRNHRGTKKETRNHYTDASRLCLV